MKFYDSNNREVIDVEIYIARSSVDSFIESAVYNDTGTKVSEDELEYLQDAYVDYVQEYSYKNGSVNHN